MTMFDKLNSCLTRTCFIDSFFLPVIESILGYLILHLAEEVSGFNHGFWFQISDDRWFSLRSYLLSEVSKVIMLCKQVHVRLSHDGAEHRHVCSTTQYRVVDESNRCAEAKGRQVKQASVKRVD